MISHQSTYNSIKTAGSFLLSLCMAIASAPSQADISQKPLLLGGGSVPGNLAFVPSVEWPTILSMANLGNYSAATKLTGYFDSEKCYQYSHDAANADRRNSHFYPVSITTTRSCGSNLWSGNYLNWAATQTIDPFRSALTGGYRVKDEPEETWLEKARHTGQNASGNRAISGSNTVQSAGPANWSNLNTRVSGLGNRLRFTGSGNLNATSATPYNPNDTIKSDRVYEVYVRVKVCDANIGLESNCERYSRGYKPEGLIQQYSDQIRYSVFGYLNDSADLRDGGVLRAQQKFVGPNTRSPGVSGTQINNAKEWDEVTGVMTRNPDTASASATNAEILDSGVINYLNKFGQMTTQNHKSIDPVSELFYTSLRYFKNQGNVSTYTDMTGNYTTRYNLADGFPVITNWNDPIQYACQKNVILGIGDVNTHRDKNLPGATSSSGEPSKPTEVSSDTTVDVVTATAKVGQLEGVDLKQNSSDYTGRYNSAYIAGLAYDANTRDLRGDISGKQTVSTYWVDVRENEALAGRASNQYWLAAKYGGFKVPDNFGDPYTRTEPLETEWWRTSTDMLDTNYQRPDNFFVASDATNMVESLRKAFAQISNEVQSTTASLATNSTRLETDTAVFQSRLDSRFWNGDLLARLVGNNGVVAENAAWSAAQKLDNLPNVNARNIFTATPDTTAGTGGEFIANNGVNFDWGSLSDSQQALLMLPNDAGAVTGANRLAYLRGDRTHEITTEDRTKPFRQRGSRLGDIVNSDPQYIHNQDFGYSRLGWGTNGSVGTAYANFRATNAYKNRTPTVIVGANDGMLHGFDARVSDTPADNGGKELFAYVPNSVFSNLINLTDPAYSHRYYVDGTPRVSDVWIGGSWKTMVVGTTGAGGKSVFALDITDPASMNASKVMWEFTHPDMGYTMGQPALVALPNEKFGVIVSSGYHDNAPQNGKVWILDAADGSIIREIELPSTGNLGSPLASDTNFDMVAERVYVADTQGNVWRIDMSDSNPSGWGIPKTLGSKPLFIAKDSSNNLQAITAPLSSAFSDKGEHMVFFGTGSFYRNGDNEIPNSPSVDSFYGIIDRGQPIDGRDNLLEQVVLKEDTVNGNRVRAISKNAIEDQTGWYLDLGWLEGTGATGAKGERVTAKATLRSDRVLFTTMTPSNDPCAAGGTSFIMAMNLSSGSRLNYVYFDTSGDGELDDGDTTTTGDDENIPWSGISDTDDGVVKGVTPLLKWLCFAGSSGATPQCIPVAGSQRFGRHSWREVRNN